MHIRLEVAKPGLLEELKHTNHERVCDLARKYKVSRQGIRMLALRHGIMIGPSKKSEYVNKGNEKYGMTWEEYVKVPGNLAWPDGVEPREEKHQSCSLGILLQQLEVG